MQRTAIRNNALNQRLPIQMTPIVDQGWLSRINALIGTAQNVAGPIAGALGGFGEGGGAAVSGAANMGNLNSFINTQTGGGGLQGFDWTAPRKSGFFNPQAIER